MVRDRKEKKGVKKKMKRRDKRVTVPCPYGLGTTHTESNIYSSFYWNKSSCKEEKKVSKNVDKNEKR
jgi:hypothetical protein